MNKLIIVIIYDNIRLYMNKRKLTAATAPESSQCRAL